MLFAAHIVVFRAGQSCLLTVYCLMAQMVGIKWQTMDVAKKEEYQQKAQRMKRRAGMVEAAPDEAEPMEEDEAPSPRSHTATDALLAVVDHISSEGGGDNTTNGNNNISCGEFPTVILQWW
jgi:hypothetical protein